MKKTELIVMGLLLASLPLLFQSPQTVHANGDQKRLGATLFHERGCEHCHGPNGTGGELGPDLSTVGKEMQKLDIERRILKGGGGMPPFADALQPDEVAALVEFLHAKKKAPKHQPTVSAPAPN